MRRYLLIGATIALLAIPALAFGRATTTVAVGPNGSLAFSPKSVTKTVGAGAITWQWKGFSHNVRQDDKLFYSGRPTNPPHTFSVVPSAGSFHYYCEVHRLQGMQGTIKIRPQILNKTLARSASDGRRGRTTRAASSTCATGSMAGPGRCGKTM
jgi:plastocyanin